MQVRFNDPMFYIVASIIFTIGGMMVITFIALGLRFTMGQLVGSIIAHTVVCLTLIYFWEQTVIKQGGWKHDERKN